MIVIDGSYGQGGGQILRSALALSLVTRKPFTINQIRARRTRAGLTPAHLVVVEAAANIGRAKVKGDVAGSKTLTFEPGLPVPGWYELIAGSRGSAALILQTILPALMTAVGPSVIKISGGTHMPMAPSVEFFNHTFLPVLKRLGPQVALTLDAPGYYPSGGGRLNVEVEPKRRLNTDPVELLDRGKLLERRVTILIASLSQNTARRQKDAFLDESRWDPSAVIVEDIEQLKGPGNMVSVMLRFEKMTQIITTYSQMGDPPEKAARQAAAEAAFFVDSHAAVDEHLADQLLLPLALAGGGKMVTTSPSLHTRTNMHIISQFLPQATFNVLPHGDKAWMIQVDKKA